MRVSSTVYPQTAPAALHPGSADAPPSAAAQAPAAPAFAPFGAEALALAHRRHVPVFLLIGEQTEGLADAAVAAQLAERTVAAQLLPGERPDVELLCQRAGAMFSQEGALPLCALLLPDGRPFLAAPLPPPGFPLDPARMFVWLSHADRRYMQNLPALVGQAAEVVRSLRAEPLRKPCTPEDAAHLLSRALTAIEDKRSGGFGAIKAPFVCGLRFLQHAAARGSRAAHASLNRALDAMLSSALLDPLDGLFFRATLTDDWRVLVPEKPLGINAMLALILLDAGRRDEAVRTLNALIAAYPLQGGALSPSLRAPRETYAFTPQQVCAALGSEDGLRACRLLGLLHKDARPLPELAPSRFSPMPAAHAQREEQEQPLCPTLSPSVTPEDAAFLRRIFPALLRVRAARERQLPAPRVDTMECALAAAILAACGQRLGETRYTQAAQRAVAALSALTPAQSTPAGLPPSIAPASPLRAQATCGASAALSLALLTLGRGEGMAEYAAGGLRLLYASLHAFVRPDGLVMHTPEDTAAWFPRVPALMDGELPSPAALLTHALRLAQAMHPDDPGFSDAAQALWHAAAPCAHAQPLSCAGLIDAMTAQPFTP